MEDEISNRQISELHRHFHGENKSFENEELSERICMSITTKNLKRISQLLREDDQRGSVL